MEKIKNWLRKYWPLIVSHVGVVAVAVAVTLAVTWFRPGKLVELERLIEQKFIGEVDKTKLEDAAAEAMIKATGDRWSYYIPADQLASYEEKKNNAYVGIGITVVARDDGAGLNITQVTAGGSAEEAGLLAGDVIIAVDGNSIAGMETDAITALIRGKVGTNVAITVLREGQEQTFSVTRKNIKTVVASGKMLQGNVGLVTIANFNTGCAEQTIAATKALVEQGAQKLIFDVRHNGGGYTSELVKVLDYLLPKGEVFRTVDYTGKEEISYSDAACVELPMAVLINGSSYSAAEFFAAALQEYEVATLVGLPTSGKGHFQITYKLSDGSAVALSVGKYYTPILGKNLEGSGLTPNAVVPVDAETAAKIQAGTLDPMEDDQILKAIALLGA